jgi:hypothetical protein
MKKLIALLLIASQAWAGLPPTTIQGQSDASPKTKFSFQVPQSQSTDLGGIKALIETGNYNTQPNPGFEAATLSGWTASSGTVTRETTAADIANGSASLKWAANASNPTLTGPFVANSNGSLGKTGVWSCNVMKSVASDSFNMTVDDGVNTYVSQTIAPITSKFTRQTVTFSYPSTGGTNLRGGFTAPTITGNLWVDDCYFGPAEGWPALSQVNQAQWVGDVYFTGCSGNFDWTGDTTYSDATATTTCAPVATGNVSVSGTNNNKPEFKVTGGPGKYVVVYGGMIGNGSATSNTQVIFRLTDGTNNSNEELVWQASTGTNQPITGNAQWSLNETSALNGTLFKIQAKEVSGGDPFMKGTSANPGAFSVYWFPSSSEISYRPDLQPISYAGYIFSGSASFSIASPTTSFQDFATASGATLTQRQNFNAGTVTEYNTTGAGIVFTPNRAGLIPVCFQFPWRTSSTAPGLFFQIADESNNEIAEQYVEATGASIVNQMTLCGTFNATNTSSHTLKLRLKEVGPAGNVDIFIIRGNVEILLGAAAVQSIATPLLMGSVTSSDSGQIHHEFAFLSGGSAACGGSPCTLTDKSGSASVTRTGTGLYHMVVASGVCSTALACTSSSNDAIGVCQGTAASSTTTQYDFSCFVSTTGAALDTRFTVQCDCHR